MLSGLIKDQTSVENFVDLWTGKLMDSAEEDSQSMLVLSDVHTHCQNHRIFNNGSHLSETRFIFILPADMIGEKQDSVAVLKRIEDKDVNFTLLASDGTGKEHEEETGVTVQTVDEDGDLVVMKQHHVMPSSECVLTVIHDMETSLNLVGKQVWPGALLLCDFVLHYNWLLDGGFVLDMGAGVGITSIVAAMVAKTVFCTDYSRVVLELAKRNMMLNGPLIKDCDVRVRELNWTEFSSDTKSDCCSDKKLANEFCLSPEEKNMLKSSSVILAAEVVYDLDITDAFFRELYHLLAEEPSKTCFMTVEKRQVFTVADRHVVSPAYEHFRENLQDLCSVDSGPVRFMCSQVDITFPQYFQYQRTKEMELWKIETVFSHR